jgi:hypothetical protein
MRRPALGQTTPYDHFGVGLPIRQEGDSHPSAYALVERSLPAR